MAQYQSFPDAAGDSRTVDKLKALRLPCLEGKSFLDVGCNEGFFCGFARFAGARRAVGIDHSTLFLGRARRRFPECEFVLGDWGKLPRGPFDVVLLASALHYADDQEALIRRLIDLLAPDGVLVLELGLVNSRRSEWRDVKRGDDVRRFPSMKKLEEILSPYAWKWLGPSVDQSGDPVKRHVVHVSRRRPFAYLLMQPPGYGKTTIARQLFGRAGVRAVSGDEVILQVARGRRAAPGELHKLLADGFSPFHIDQTIQRVFAAGAGRLLVQEFASEANGEDFALDVYVPAECHPLVEETLRGLGYLPVRLDWNRIGIAPPPAELQEQRLSGWMEQLGAKPLRSDSPRPGRGYVDSVEASGGMLTLIGWAADHEGSGAATALEIRIGGNAYTVRVSTQPRRDVQRRLQLRHERFGFRAEWAPPPGVTAEELVRTGTVGAVLGSGKVVPLRWAQDMRRLDEHVSNGT